MPYNQMMEQQQGQSQSLKQMQRLIMSRQMQQAIHFLQVPVMELSPLVELELEQNPVLENSAEPSEDDGDINQLDDEAEEESTDLDMPDQTEVTFDDRDFEILRRLDEDFRDYVSESGSPSIKRSAEEEKLQTYLESSVVAEVTLFDYLMDQAREAFADESERKLAEFLIGSLDESGFLGTPLIELSILAGCQQQALQSVLSVIQTFDPVGIGAENLRKSLLLQLKAKGKEKTLAYKIIDHHFEDLKKNHIPAIKTGLHATSEAIREAIDNDIVPLDLRPGGQISRCNSGYIVPDMLIVQEGDELSLVLNDQSLPPLRLNRKYLRMLDDESLPEETREFIKERVGSAKWLMRNIMQRNETLERIGQVLIDRQKEFLLNPAGRLVPLTMQSVADELELHESTIARAVSNKYVETPRGLLLLRSFFTNALEREGGDAVSSKTVHDLVIDLINGEDKNHPLSDEAISLLIQERGIHCARRTVAKYRVGLGIGNAQQRRKF